MTKLPILKSDKQSQHFRTSKTGKVFSAGKGVKKDDVSINQLKTLKNNVLENIKGTWERWKKDYPEEEGIENFSYMEFELKNTVFPGAGFILHSLKNGNVTKGTKKVNDAVECTMGRCYYNALDYSKRTGADLAFGYIIEPDSIDKIAEVTKKGKRARANTMLHVFNVVDGEVIDPTMGRDTTSIITYEIVPKEVWEKFSYKEKDPDQDARELDYWMVEKMEKYDKEIDKILEE